MVSFFIIKINLLKLFVQAANGVNRDSIELT